jgi:hypothetical protein
MAKTKPEKTGDTTLDTLKPYLERALRDPEFRADLKDAILAARELYGPLTKGGGVKGSAKVLATDKKAQEQLFRAFEDVASAAGTLTSDEPKKAKKSRKGRKMLLLAGIVAGALYNPWTGPQTREKLLDLIAGDDDLKPLEDFGETVAETASNGKATAADAAEKAAEATAEAAEELAEAAEAAADAAAEE